MNAQAVETPLMGHKNAISQRRHTPRTPLAADNWEATLLSTNLITVYPQIPTFIRFGAHAGIPHITTSYTPSNKDSTVSLATVFNDILQTEFNKGRYIGPFTQGELERKIRPFQSSPLSLVPKAGKPGKYRLIQNLSYPHSDIPVPSINSHLNSDDFPCTWGTFRSVCTLVRNLPPGSQATVRDIAEAYRIIPLHESQWPGVVVRISNEPAQFALNTCNSFGCTTAGGLFGMFGDALADILRVKGIGPILKWVDDFLFLRIPKSFIPTYNEYRERRKKAITNNGSLLQTRGQLWYKGEAFDEVGAKHFAENMSAPVKHIRDHWSKGTLFPYGFPEIDEITNGLGIPWELSKDVPFDSIVPFIGLSWNLAKKTVALLDSKKDKYLCAILEWKNKPSHTLEETQKLYGKLLYACHVVPRGHTFLTNLKKMMGIFHNRPFTPRHPPKHLTEDLDWWEHILSQPSLSREIPGGRAIIDLNAFSDASSTTSIGIVIGDRWRAWHLLPGWKSRGRDIGWAEAVGMELLLRTALSLYNISGLLIHGDNNGVIEGWWAGRSRNAEINYIFRRIHKLLESNNTIISTRYVNTTKNPADGPSRGVYPSFHLLLPPIELPTEVKPFLVDFDAPTHPHERNSAQGLHLPCPKIPLSDIEHRCQQQANNAAHNQLEETSQMHSPDDYPG